jgi:pyruvate/2-oxoglutarate/acetoin dehydrogenase E1 component
MSQRMTTNEAIRAILATAENVALVGEQAGHTPTTMGLEAIRTPISDRATVGLAVGLAMSGKRAVVELSSSGRLLAVAEALADLPDAGFRIPLVVRVPIGHQAGPRIDRPAAELLATLDGITVVCSCDTATATGLVLTALASDSPIVILEPRSIQQQRGVPSASPLPLHARVLRQGRDATLAAWGDGVAAALEASAALAEEGISAGVVDLVCLNPLDAATLTAQVKVTGRLIAVHPSDPAFADRLLRTSLDAPFLYLESPVARAEAEPGKVVKAVRECVAF